MTTIDAKLRITPDTAAAATGVRNVKVEVDGLGAALDKTSKKAVTPETAAGVTGVQSVTNAVDALEAAVDKVNSKEVAPSGETGASGVRVVKTEVDNLGTAVENVGRKMVAAVVNNPFKGLGVTIAQTTPEVRQLSSAQLAFMAQLRESAELWGKSSSEVLRYRAAQMGLKDDASELIRTLEQQSDAAQKTASLAAAQKELANSQGAFLSQLRESAELWGKSSTEVMRYRAAQLGVKDDAEALIQTLQLQADAAEKTATQAAKQRDLAASQQALASSQKAFMAQLRESSELWGKSSSDVLRYRAAQIGLADDAETLIQTLERQSKASGISAAQTAAAMRTLPAQMTDIVTQLQGGASPLTILFQQGGQIKDSFGGAGNAVKALTSLITPLRLGVTAGAAVLLMLASASYQAYAESDKLNKSIEITGGAIGVTSGQIRQASVAIAEANDASIGSVRQTLQSAADTNVFLGETIGSAANAATALTRITGGAADDAIKDFTGMADGVAQWAAKTNKAYNFITAEQYKYIRSLEAQGRTQEAMRVTLDALSEAMQGRQAKAVGDLERLWNGLGTALGNVWDKLKGIGREETAEEAVKRLTKAYEEMEAARAKGGVKGWFGETVDDLKDQTSAAAAELSEATRKRDAEHKAAADKAKEAAAEQERIRKASKAWQDGLAQVEMAGAQKRLAQQTAHLDQEQAALESSYARGLISAEGRDKALAHLEQQRLKAQRAALLQQRAIEAGRVEERPEDKVAKQATLTQLDAQLAEINGRIGVAATNAGNVVSAAALERQRERAQQWAEAWKTAADAVRAATDENAAAAADRLTDPLQRAEAAADLATRDKRRDLSDKKRDLEIAIRMAPSDGARAELEAQLGELGEAAQMAIDEAMRTAKLSSLRDSFSDLYQALAQAEADADQQVEAGVLTALEAERVKFAERAKALPQLQAIADAQAKLAATPRERNEAASAAAEVKKVKDQKDELEKTVRSSGESAFSGFFTDIATGAKTASEAFRDMVSSFARSMLDLIAKRLGEKLINSMMGSSTASGGSGSAGWGTDIMALFQHTGGVTGASGTGWTQSVPAAAWNYAPRYHSGGIAGLRPNEIPAVLERGEEVLTADDPRHVRNGGALSSLGGVSIGVTVNGAEGSSAQQKAAGDSLGQAMLATVNAWAVDQSRPGGILFKG